MSDTAPGEPAGGRLVLLIRAARPLRSLRHGLQLACTRELQTWVGASDSALTWIEAGLVEKTTQTSPAGRSRVVTGPSNHRP